MHLMITLVGGHDLVTYLHMNTLVLVSPQYVVHLVAVPTYDQNLGILIHILANIVKYCIF